MQALGNNELRLEVADSYLSCGVHVTRNLKTSIYLINSSPYD